MKPEELRFRELIEYVCFKCGEKYGAPLVLYENYTWGVQEGRCDICERDTIVVNKRHYNYVRALTFEKWINAKKI